MARKVESSFEKFEFLDSEKFILSELQTQHIKTKICTIAETILALQLDTQDYEKFLQDQANLQGRIYIMNLLLDESSDNIEAINNELQDQ